MAERPEPIEMPFGMWTCVGPRKQLLDGGHPSREGGNLGNISWPIVEYRAYPGVFDISNRIPQDAEAMNNKNELIRLVYQ